MEGPTKTIVPSSSQAAPPKELKAESESVAAALPSGRTIRSFRSAMKAIHLPSGENVG